MGDIISLDKIRRERAVPECFRGMIGDMVARGMMPDTALADLPDLWEHRRQHGPSIEETRWGAIKTREYLAAQGYRNGGHGALAELRERLQSLAIERAVEQRTKVEELMSELAKLVRPGKMAAVRTIIERDILRA